ncbi:hypothetical protein Pcinc_008120 [Petrolisthes cinctipes]|uniref:Uncharacterized protein n=1 Tax=Petrolisthes cinctipes TaxID=88211 RepID=A0AAE1G9Y1_PETCI|nr:hypothetical protein Pcinc_008120 [Petrolisthes cinctipes]
MNTPNYKRHDCCCTFNVHTTTPQVFRISRKIKAEEEVELLQEDLNRVFGWAEENNMSLNGDEFELLSFKNKLDSLSGWQQFLINLQTRIHQHQYQFPPVSGPQDNMRGEELPGTSGRPC